MICGATCTHERLEMVVVIDMLLMLLAKLSKTMRNDSRTVMSGNSNRLSNWFVNMWVGVCYGIMWGFGVCVVMGIGQG